MNDEEHETIIDLILQNNIEHLRFIREYIKCKEFDERYFVSLTILCAESEKLQDSINKKLKEEKEDGD